ncbi:MAG: ATP-binding protein [Verrucomicrobiia bacterium]
MRRSKTHFGGLIQEQRAGGISAWVYALASALLLNFCCSQIGLGQSPNATKTPDARRESSLWGGYRWQIVGGMSLILLQGVSIAVLLWHRGQRRAAAEDLQISEAYLAGAQRLSHIGRWATTLATDTTDWSAETFRIFGYDPDGITPSPKLMMERIHTDDREAVQTALHQIPKDPKPCKLSFRITMPNGDVKHLDTICQPMCDGRGGVVKLIGSVMDVTDRKRHEMAMASSSSEEFARSQGEVVAMALEELAKKTSFEHFLCRILQMIGQRLDAYSVSVWLRDEPTERPTLRVTFAEGEIIENLNPADPAERPLYRLEDIPLWHELTRTGRTVVCDDVAASIQFTPHRQYLDAHNISTIICLPLLFGGGVIGMVSVCSAKTTRPSPDLLDLAQALAHQVTLAIQLKDLMGQSWQAAVLEERNRLAREIHDTIAQAFIGVIIHLRAAENAFAHGVVAEAGEHIRRASTLARQSLGDARRSVRALRPEALERADLWGALDALIKQMTIGTNLRGEFAMHGEPRRLRPSCEENLMRIQQEAVTNALKHASARTVKVTLSFEEHRVVLAVQDDGIGFDPSNQHDGFGLLGIRERTTQMKGELTIDSGAGQGTRICVALPYQNQTRDTES